MKTMILGLTAGLFFMMCPSCTSGGRNAETVDVTETAETFPERREVKIVYASPEAINAPKYAKGVVQDGPLSLLDLDNQAMTMVEGITDIGAWQNEDKRQMTIWFTNPTEDTVRVAELLLPDRRFEAVWEGRPDYIPDLSGGFKLMADSVEYIEDYRIVLKYLDDQYPPQVFHINIYPDLVQLRRSRGLM